MNLTHFKSSFLLTPLQRKKIPHSANLKKAAVLVPFVARRNGLHLILTQRSSKLKHHPGQISFPGGSYEHSDKSLEQTAIRETHEEIGILENQISIIGQLDLYQTVSRFVVTPFVGLVDPDYQVTIDYGEVAEVFEVPWAFFTSRANHHQIRIWRLGKFHQVHFMPFAEKLIWGTTAHIIHDLVSHFE